MTDGFSKEFGNVVRQGLAEVAAEDGASEGQVPTVQPGGAVAFGGSLQVATVQVSADEILALFTAPKTLIAAPGVGKLLTVQGFCLQFIAGDTPYATVTDVGLEWEGGGGTSFGGSILDQATNQITLDDLVYSGPQSAIENKAVQLTADGANPTAGNGTIELTVYYTVVTLS